VRREKTNFDHKHNTSIEHLSVLGRRPCAMSKSSGYAGSSAESYVAPGYCRTSSSFRARNQAAASANKNVSRRTTLLGNCQSAMSQNTMLSKHSEFVNISNIQRSNWLEMRYPIFMDFDCIHARILSCLPHACGTAEYADGNRAIWCPWKVPQSHKSDIVRLSRVRSPSKDVLGGMHTA
jgi:hypothetical protein